jgi:hypothetical protein
VSNLHPGDKVNPQEAGRLLNEQAARLARRSGKTAAQEVEVAEALRRTSNEGLLKTFAALTHRLHAADRKAEHAALALDIRAQRDRVEQEILRRMTNG